MSRAKGNRLEREVARRLITADGQHPVYGRLASSTGRVGHLDLGADIITRSTAVECKNREDLTSRLWEWLDHIDVPGQMPVLVIKRNLRRPLAVLDLDHLEHLLAALPGASTPSPTQPTKES